jgi:sulfonate transport system substrate-binding protein
MHRSAIALLAVLAIAVSACGGASGPSSVLPTATTAATAGAEATIGTDAGITEVRVDYATYSPPSLVLKQQGWVEQAFPGVSIKWVYSAGSSNALNFLQANSIDFGSTAGSAALLSRANGNPIKAIYIYEQPEWTALVVAKDSTAKSIADLKGKKIAAQKGTDPYFFLLRTLQQAGLSQADIQYVNLPHAEGRTALERGQVDGWSGLDPHMAASELQAGSKLIYRNKDFNTYGFLNAREDFLRKYPETTKRLIQLYERAKQWVIDNPADAAQILSDAAQLSLDVAKRELNERMNFKTSGIPGEAHLAVLRAVVPTINAEQLAQPGANVDKAVTDLIDGTYAKAVIK